MNSKIITYVLIPLICFIPGLNLLAQYQTTLYADIGKTVVSDGLFVKMADLTSYRFGKNKLEAGLQIDILSNTDRVFSGYNTEFSREWMIKSFPIETQAFFILSPFSDILRETNWGMLLGIYRNHFTIKIGTNFRTYAYNQKAVTSYSIETDTRLHENWNLMYSFNGYIKPIDNVWNIGLSVTNIDHFIINQETNPILNLRFAYKFKPSFKVYFESWYKSAGALNLYVNYFGFFIRTGIIWDINLTD
jgi:hypothetical protein